MKSFFNIVRNILAVPGLILTIALTSCSSDLCNRARSPKPVLEDFDYFFREFEQTHPDPYSAFGGERKFHKKVKILRRTLSRAEGLDADRLQAEIGRFLVPLHDGHTYCGQMKFSYDSEVKSLPLNLRTMTNGFFVWSAPEDSRGLLGAEVKSIGDLMSDDDGMVPETVSDSLRNAIIDGYMCLDKDMLRAQDGKPLYRPEHVYVVTNEDTFSAAFHFTYMLWKMGATIVGVPSSQAPNTFMESTPFTLPNTGIECSVSNSIQRFFPKEDPRAKVFWPDWAPTWDDYRHLGFVSRADLLYILGKISK